MSKRGCDVARSSGPGGLSAVVCLSGPLRLEISRTARGPHCSSSLYPVVELSIHTRKGEGFPPCGDFLIGLGAPPPSGRVLPTEWPESGWSQSLAAQSLAVWGQEMCHCFYLTSVPSIPVLTPITKRNITNENLLYSTGNSTQCSVVTWRKSKKRGDICMHIADSLRWAAETNTTL